MLNTSKFSNSPTELSQRIVQLRAKMKDRGAHYCLVRATDSYLNEYVPVHKSRRAFITGFTGSLGDALIGLDAAYLFVDGRYALQAKEQAPYFDVTVLPLGKSIENAWLEILESKAFNQKVLVEEDRIDVSLYEMIAAFGAKCNFSIENDNGIIDSLRPQNEDVKPAEVWKVNENLTGTTLSQRLEVVTKELDKSGVNGFLLVALDDIAWMSGFRGSDFDYQCTFAARAMLMGGDLWVIAPHAGFADEGNIRQFSSLKSAVDEINVPQKTVLGYDPNTTPYSVFKALMQAGMALAPIKNPVQQLKSRKNEVEIGHMYSTFSKADDVVYATQNWVSEQVMNKKEITEADVDRFVRAKFEESGTVGLSFTPICGFAKNGAVIHHSVPDTKTVLREGEMFLLDTGGIYEGGYSTDLTRTFLIGDANTKAKPEHKFMYTIVLKGAIAGMSARLPAGITGVQLDAIVRAPLWQLGLDYAHGTGHGIGINVHEFPPRISTVGTAKLEVGHVFSIEPGLYIPGFGGVRIENLCTLIKDNNKNGYVRVQPLTFAPLDERLIEKTMLSPKEVLFLEYYKKRYLRKENDWKVSQNLDDLPIEITTVLPKV